MNETNKLNVTDKCKKINSMLNSDDFNKLNKYYQHETFMNIVGTARNENRHSDFLAWLFDSSKKHGLKNFAVKKLLEAIVVKASTFDTTRKEAFGPNKGKNFLGDFDNNKLVLGTLYQNYDIGETTVKREWTEWNGSYRLDIWIEFEMTVIKNNPLQKESKNVAIAIENKIDSSENYYELDSKPYYQTELYWDLLENAINVDKILPVLLLPSSETLAKSDKFFTLSYQVLLDNVLEQCLQETTDLHSKLLIEDYIRCLGQATIYADSENDEKQSQKTKNQITLMAVGKAEESMVKSLVKNHGESLKQILEDAIMAENEKADDNNLYSDYYMIPANRQFYRSLFFAIMYMSDFVNDFDKEFINDIFRYKEAVNKSVNKKPYFIIKDEEGKKTTYTSHGKNGKTLGRLGYELIKRFCQKPCVKSKHDIDKLIDKLRDQLNPSEKTNLWIAMVCVYRSELEENLRNYVINGNLNPIATDSKNSKYGLWEISRYFIDNHIKVDGTKLNLNSFKEKGSSIKVDVEAINIDSNSANDIFVTRWWGENEIKILLKTLKADYGFCEFDTDTRVISFY